MVLSSTSYRWILLQQRHKNSEFWSFINLNKSEKILKKGLFMNHYGAQMFFQERNTKKHPILWYCWDVILQVMIDVDSWIGRPAQCLWYHFHVVKAMQTLYGRQVKLLLVRCCKMEKIPRNVQAQGGRVLFKTLEGFQSLSCMESYSTTAFLLSGHTAQPGVLKWPFLVYENGVIVLQHLTVLHTY